MPCAWDAVNWDLFKVKYSEDLNTWLQGGSYMNDFDWYQEQSKKYDKSNGESWYYALGLAGETGEVVELIKKAHRKFPYTRPLMPLSLRDELGDVLWYIANLARHHGLSLRDIAMLNLQKLEARYKEEHKQW